MALIAPLTSQESQWLTALLQLASPLETAIECAQVSWDVSPAATGTMLIMAAIGTWTALRLIISFIIFACGVLGIEFVLVKIPVKVQYKPAGGPTVFELWIVPTADSKRWHCRSDCSIFVNERVAKANSYLPCRHCSKHFWPKDK